jgi:putative PEP-CTERM system TPR-repeat lipoprotein
MKINRQVSCAISIAILMLSLTACQPTAEERMSRAEAYIAEADYRTAAIELRNVLQVTPDDGRARLLLGQTSYQLGDFATAVSQYERALGLGQVSPESWVGYGRALLSQGRARDALERVVPDLDSSSENEVVQVFLGDVLFALANYDDANGHYTSAVAVNSSSLRGLIGQAMVHAAKNETTEAQQLLDHAAELAPGSSFVWMMKGNFHRSSNRFEDAASAYENAAQLETPNTPIAEHFATRVNLVSSLIDSGRLVDADSWLLELQSDFPDHPVSGFLRGRLAFENGDYNFAQMELQDYLARNPGDARGEAILGAINFSQDNLRQAEAHLLKAVQANAGGEATRRLLAETQLRLNNPSAALEALRNYGTLDQSDALYTAMLGRTQIAAGDTGAAIQYFEQSISQEPNNASVRLALATAYLKANRVSSAVELLDAMPIEAGSLLRRQTLLIAALARQNNHKRAIEESDKLINANPDDAAAYVVAGALWQSIGDPERASSSYQLALAVDPNDLAAQYGLSRMALASGDMDAASIRLKKLLDGHPSHIPAIISLGMVLQKAGNLDGLRPFLVNAIEASPDVMAPHVVLARLELALGQPDAVLQAVDAAQALFPDEPEFDHLRGLGLLAKGENEKSLRSLLVAVAASPSNAAFRFDLAQSQLVNHEYDAAFETARAFVGLLPADPRGPALITDAAIRSGSPDRARDYVLEFAKANPDHADGSLLLGDIEFANDNAELAAGHYETAAEKTWNRTVAMRLARSYSVAKRDTATAPLIRWLGEHAEDDGVRHMYAQLLESEGEIGAAKSEYETLLARGKLNATGMNNLAWQYALARDERAVGLARKAHELAPADGNITDTLGWILAEQGNVDDALPLLREAVTQAPDNAEIRFHLASVLAKTGNELEASKILDELLRSAVSFPSRAAAEHLSESL